VHLLGCVKQRCTLLCIVTSGENIYSYHASHDTMIPFFKNNIFKCQKFGNKFACVQEMYICLNPLELLDPNLKYTKRNKKIQSVMWLVSVCAFVFFTPFMVGLSFFLSVFLIWF
jgi:hypothetical protein